MSSSSKQQEMAVQPQIRTVLLAELNPAPYNPRRISDEAYAGLKASLDRYGLVQPIIWNEQTGNVVGGHMRLRVLNEQGATETPVVVVNIAEAEEKALNLALNNPAISGEFTGDVGLILDELEMVLPDVVASLRLESLAGLADAFNVDGIGMPELPSGESHHIDGVEKTFALTVDQEATIDRALAKAKDAGPFPDTGNASANGNALERIAEAYLVR